MQLRHSDTMAFISKKTKKSQYKIIIIKKKYKNRESQSPNHYNTEYTELEKVYTVSIANIFL